MDTETAREKLLTALMDSALESDLTQGVLRSGPHGLPRRWLPHGVYHDIYMLYCAHQLANAEKVASSSTFYRTLKSSGWKQKLKFSPPSAHSKCSICQQLRSRIQSATSIQEHASCCDRLLRHLAGQFCDRSMYHQCRQRAKSTGDILCAIQDGMDRSKYALPRFHRGQVPKDIENMKRPSLEVTTTMVHGVGIYTYLSDENQVGGSNWSLECLNRSLQHVHDKYQKMSKPVPRILKIFGDNTPKDWLFHLTKHTMTGCLI